jgi:phytanoyl-CoA hydroxylase
MLTSEQCAFYRENGYLLMKSLFSPTEAGEFRRECHALAERLSANASLESTWQSAKGTVAQGKSTMLLGCHNVQFYAAAFSRLIVDDRLTAAAADIIDSPNVQLHHTKMFIKPPEKGSPFPLHQDYPFFPHARNSMIAAICHFDDAPVGKGCVCVVPGSQKLGPLEHDPAGSYHLPLDQYPLESAIPCPAKAGDVLFFSYLTIHGSGVNVSDEARTTVLIQMRDPLDTPTVTTHESRGQGMLLRGFDPAAVLRGID